MDASNYEPNRPTPWANLLEGASLFAAAMGLVGACCATGPLAIGCLGGAAGVFYFGYSGADIIRSRASIPESPETPERHQEPASLLESVAALYELNPDSPPQAKRWVESSRQPVADTTERCR